MINNFNKCLERVEKKHFFIKDGDDQEPAFIVKRNGEFEVINNIEDPINFLKIDSCIYGSSDDTRCDCAIYNDDTFCFIELKCIKTSAVTKNRKKAETQLEATIIDFKNEGVLQNKTLEAYACLNCRIKIDDTFEPITQKPKNSEKEAHFMETLNTKLYYECKKEFN